MTFSSATFATRFYEPKSTYGFTSEFTAVRNDTLVHFAIKSFGSILRWPDTGESTQARNLTHARLILIANILYLYSLIYCIHKLIVFRSVSAHFQRVIAIIATWRLRPILKNCRKRLYHSLATPAEKVN